MGGLLAGLHQGLGWEDAAGSATRPAPPASSGSARSRPTPCGRAGAHSNSTTARASNRARARRSDGRRDARRLDVVLDELAAQRKRIDAASYQAALTLIRDAESRGGRLHVTGVGKPEHLARYGASLLSSTGTPTSFLHATEAVHGSAGQIVPGDVVIAISNSGRTRNCSPPSAPCAASARASSQSPATRSRPSRKTADLVLDAGVAREGGGLGLRRARASRRRFSYSRRCRGARNRTRLHARRVPRAPSGGAAGRAVEEEAVANSVEGDGS